GGREGVEGEGDGLLDWEEFLRGGQGVQEVGAAGGAAGPSGPLVGSPVDDSEITARPLKVLQVYWKSLPDQPTIQEIGEAIGLKGNSGVENEQVKLEKAGYLSLLPGKNQRKYALAEKGRKLFEQPADVTMEPAVPDGQIRERLSRYQEVLKAIGELTEQMKRGPVTKWVTAKINETAADKVNDDMVRSAVRRLKKDELLTGETRELHDLSDKGWVEFRLLVGGGARGAEQPADVAVGPVVPDGQISQLAPWIQKVLKAIGELSRQMKRGPVTKQVAAKINETAAKKMDDNTLSVALTHMRKDKLLTGETRGVHDLSDKGWMEFWLLVGGGALLPINGQTVGDHPLRGSRDPAIRRRR
ncbi:hypothetical protein, partial [Streptomyces sp. NPDC002172]